VSARFWRTTLGAGTCLLLAGCALPGPGRAPIADRPIELDARCQSVGQTGLKESSRLAVQASAVRALSWQIDGGARGQCRFELDAFRQTRARPHIELVSREGSGCKLMIWRDPRHITLSHAGCDRLCSGALLADALPVIFDPARGGCAAS
jgi:hypothetical protein